jgi:hypothetical protein
MKKFTSFLIAGLMVFVASASAAVQQARVILNANTNYEVQIDGRTYNSNGTSTITDLATGNHTVAVYQVVSNGVFGIGKKRNLISSEQFNLGNNDVTIDVNQNGQARISQNGYNGNNNNDRDRNGGYNGQHSDKGEYGRSEGKGKGNKYGHYKDKKGKNKKQKSNHDDDDDDDNRGYRRGNN